MSKDKEGLDTSPDPAPFPQKFQLNEELDLEGSGISYLPGYPRVHLNDSQQLTAFLDREFWAADLEKISPRLWVMTTQSSANISSLHYQRVKGREIVLTEDPRLHLVWIYNRVFIKPLPKYLLSYRFWTTFLLSEPSPLGIERDKLCKAALGYLRTFYYLIEHESDFDIACRAESRLVPPGVTWEQFCNFSDRFKDRIQDSDVSGRYQFGELRLTRLNLYVKIFLSKFVYERVHAQYGDYFNRFYAPLLFIFGILSLMLNAMQVEMNVEALTKDKWMLFWRICRWFSVITLAVLLFLSFGLVSLLLGMVSDEWIFAIRVLRSKKKDKRKQCTV